ncbi:polyribonucleotide nucleotidyltransferase [Clostridium sp. CAG:1193]|nr:polyribonucleotide nucleotidyltransferase [Clostridium sp. CAG:1193]
MDKKIFELDFRGRKIVVENGELAKQAAGAVLVRYGDTVTLAATTVSKECDILSDFFPLTVVYMEKQYAVGKIPGGFIKREGRPTEAATLCARMIDRPMRPLFPENFRNKVDVVNEILSVDQDNTPEMTALFASSLAVSISEIPFNGPVAGVKVGRVNGEFIINPTAEEMEESDIDLTVAGTMDAVNMVESGSKEVSEDDMLDAIMFGHDAIKELLEFANKIIKEIGKEKMVYEVLDIETKLREEVELLAKTEMIEAIKIKDKLERNEAVERVKEEVIKHYTDKNIGIDDILLETLLTKVKLVLADIEKSEFRRLVADEKIRPDGRKVDEIRPLSASIDLLPRTHGSALFTRGQTQALSITTLGSLTDNQILDGLGVEDSKRFMLHYNFPQFSVGETGRYGSPGRREIGHGALGERALLQVIPSEEEFPYTIRVVSEILESNGSSSQASICAGCLSLMAAGVPIKSPVAGIAMGLLTKGENYTILTDIQGMEDHLGDMDFKVAGTRKGICALQMDIKIKGITKKIMSEALAQAKKARMQIIDLMETVIKEPRKELSPYAPKIEQFTINPEKIKDVIGKGGEMITKIILEASDVKSVNDINAVKVELLDDGRVIIYHKDKNIINKTKEMIENVVKEVEEGKIYVGKVVKVEDFGCFVELWPGCEGLVHISHLDTKRVEKTSDIVKVGDEIVVKAIGYDKRGKLNLSRKEVLSSKEDKKDKKSKTKED